MADLFTMAILIEVIKVVITSAVTSLVLSYFFNKKLEEQKTLLKVSEKYMTSLIEGINDFIGAFKAVVIKLDEIEAQLDSDSINEESVKDFRNLAREYTEKVRQHRIYLVPLIPFGGSYKEVCFQTIMHLPNLLDTYLKMLVKGDERCDEFKVDCAELFDTVRTSYISTTEKANHAVMRLSGMKKIK
jgi:hypothetical protein